MIEERVTQQEIANRLACSREMVGWLMKDLQSGGYVEMRDRRIVLNRCRAGGGRRASHQGVPTPLFSMAPI